MLPNPEGRKVVETATRHYLRSDKNYLVKMSLTCALIEPSARDQILQKNPRISQLLLRGRSYITLTIKNQGRGEAEARYWSGAHN